MVDAKPNSPGMSGAKVFCCSDNTGQRFALRRWPAETDQDRVGEIHRVVAAARFNGCAIVPQQLPMAPSGSTFAVDGGFIWDLATWVDGEAIRCDASMSMVAEGAAAIGRFHHAVERLASRHEVAPALLQRSKLARQIDAIMPRIAELDFNTLSLLRAPSPQQPLIQSLTRARDLLRTNWASVHQQYARLLSESACQPVTTQYVLRDVHREHLLFTNTSVTGLIDFDAIRIDTPITDLVRWGGGFQLKHSDSETFWDEILAAHQSESSSLESCSPNQFRHVAAQMHRISTWISLANWLIWLAVESRSFDVPAKKIAERIDELAELAVLAT
ncbi:MAG: aminoglycoside phosphotransferase family protein [Pirellulaceae bacterium]